MERLTERKRNIDGTGVAIKEITDGLLTSFASEILTRLADYEDSEEQGLLLKLPCKVGSTVYHINGQCIFEYKIVGFSTYYMSTQLYVYLEDSKDRNDSFKINEIGKTLFLTREEAEDKLKELENGLQK